MEDHHYLTSVTIHKATDLKYCEGRLGNPFCILDVMGTKKCTNFRRRTSNPVWDQRIDIVTDFKPKSALLIIKDYVNSEHHKTVGQTVLDLEGQLSTRCKTLSSPLTVMDPSGRILSRGDLTFQLNHQTINSKRHHHYSWTDILYIDVTDVKDLPLYTQCLQRGHELMLQTRCGVQQFTSLFLGGDVKRINSSGFFFVDDHSMLDKSLSFTLVMQDKKGEDTLIGDTVMKIKDLFKTDKGELEHKLVLKEKSDGNGERPIGHLLLYTKLISRQEIEGNMADTIFEEYDYDFDGRLNREELFDMLATLQPSKNIDEMKTHLDELGMTKESFIRKPDLIRFLHSSALHSQQFINLLIISSLKNRSFPSTAHLMRGFSYPTSPNSSFVNIIDRNSNKMFEEKIPTYITLAVKAMGKHDDEETEQLSRDLIPRLTSRQGWHFDTPKSTSEILPFMGLHRIRPDSIKNKVSKFKSFNDFFARQLNPEDRPVHSPGRSNVAVSPSDCRLMAFKDIKQADKLWIKGEGLSLRELLCKEAVSARYYGGSVVICRLAPRDSHRWGSPVDGKQRGTFEIKGEQRVNHPAVDKSDGMRLCHRVVSEIDSDEFGSVCVVAVGGPMINSIKITAKPNQFLRRGESHGVFQFGGSTLVLLFRENRVYFDKDLLRNSQRPIETYVRANDRIALALQPKDGQKKDL